MKALVTTSGIESPAPRSLAKPISWRPRTDIGARFERVARAARRSKSSLLHETMDEKLPVMEKKYRRELKALALQEAQAKAA